MKNGLQPIKLGPFFMIGRDPKKGIILHETGNKDEEGIHLLAAQAEG